MKLRRPVRAALGGLAVALAVAGLAGCRTDPNVAAYVGDDTISVRQLDDAVAAREAQPEMAAYVAAHRDTYPRQVLGLLVTEQVYTDAEQHFGVHVDDAAVRTELDQRLAGADTAQQYAAAAQQGYSRQDVFELIREQLVRRKIAHVKGLDGALTDSALRAAYQKQLPTLTKKQLGAIGTPDQATADAVIAQLQKDPASYPAVAAAHAGQSTEPTLQEVDPSQLSSALQARVAAAAPNTAFSIANPGGGVEVLFVGPTVTTSFEDARPQLQSDAATTVDDAAQKVVADYRKTLSLTVNPRYGVLDANGQLSDPTGGAVQLLEDPGASPSGTPAAAGG